MKAHYDKTDNGIVEIAKDGEPVILTIFKASKLLKNLGKVIPKKLQREFWFSQPSIAIPHTIK